MWWFLNATTDAWHRDQVQGQQCHEFGLHKSPFRRSFGPPNPILTSIGEFPCSFPCSQFNLLKITVFHTLSSIIMINININIISRNANYIKLHHPFEPLFESHTDTPGQDFTSTHGELGFSMAPENLTKSSWL